MNSYTVYPKVRTLYSVKAKNGNDTHKRTWTTDDEIEWLARLKKGNPAAFEAYKKSFFTRKVWDRTVEPKVIAGYLGLRYGA